MVQVNARKIYDEPNVLAGMLDNRLFLGILGSELLLQARTRALPVRQCAAGMHIVTDAFSRPHSRLDQWHAAWHGHSV